MLDDLEALRAKLMPGDEVSRLKARIAELEDAIEPLLPYAMCDNYKLEGMFLKTADGQKRYEDFQRRTIYMDLGVFQRLAHLMEKNGA